LEGIEQNRRGYQPKYHEEMTKFVFDYFTFASREYAHLGIQEAKPRPAGSTWIMFYPESLPREINLVHQLTAGFVKVFFNGQAEAFDALKEKYSLVLPKNTFIDVAGKSVTISMKVPKIDPLSISFQNQLEKIRQALESLSLLEKVVSANAKA
jgi:hypothetical protein